MLILGAEKMEKDSKQGEGQDWPLYTASPPKTSCFHPTFLPSHTLSKKSRFGVEP